MADKSKIELPTAIAESEIKLGDITLRCAVLDNGERVIWEEDIIKFLNYIGSGGTFTEEQADILAAFVKK